MLRHAFVHDSTWHAERATRCAGLITCFVADCGFAGSPGLPLPASFSATYTGTAATAFTICGMQVDGSAHPGQLLSQLQLRFYTIDTVQGPPVYPTLPAVFDRTFVPARVIEAEAVMAPGTGLGAPGSLDACTLAAWSVMRFDTASAPMRMPPATCRQRKARGGWPESSQQVGRSLRLAALLGQQPASVTWPPNCE